MARSSTRTTRSTRKDEGTAVRPVHDQPTPFLGLLLAPFAALLLTWVIHFSIMGWTIGGHTVDGSPAYLGLAIVLTTLAAVGIGTAAWHFSYDRHRNWRVALTVSATLVGLWLPVLISVGPNRWVSIFFVITVWAVSALWALPRLHVLRRDPREHESEGSADDLMRELGLEGYKSRGNPEISYDENGEPTRIVADVRHKFGGKRDRLQNAIGNLESAVGGPEGRSRVTAPPDGKSNHSIVTIMLRDPFTGRIPLPTPVTSHPGGSVSDYAVVGMYDDGEPVHVWAFGGISPITGDKMPPVGYAFMGMTRSGKTVTENRLLLDGVITRRDGVILYLNKSKGMQDVAPIIAGVEVAVLPEEREARGTYKHAFGTVIEIMNYRQRQLGRYGIAAWSADKCFSNPPTHTVDGKPEPMEPMPCLVVHVGEADTILEEAHEESIAIASKGLSLGVVAGWSMQRWAATTMPTDLRFNIGTAFCFGTGDSYSAEFALSEQTIKAGARPDHWKNRKPGQFYVENNGIEEHRFPVSAKGIGDVDDDALYGNMRLLAEEYAPQMAKLDAGSADATGGQWARWVRDTDILRATLTPGGSPAPTVPDDPAPAPTRQESPMGGFTATDPKPHEDADLDEARQQVAEDLVNMTEIDGREIRGDLIRPDPDDPTGDQLFREMREVDLATPIPPPEPDDTDFGGTKPEASSPQEAQLRFDESLRVAVATEQWRDPDDPNSVIVRVHQLHELYPFRARSWFSTMLSDMADGKRTCPPGITVERIQGHPKGPGFYRITNRAG